MEDIYRHVGRRIREERVRRRWTQERLAEKTEYHLSFIGQLERGTKKPSLQALKRIADAFGIKAGELLGEPSPDSRPYPLEKQMAGLIEDRPPREKEILYGSLRYLARQLRTLSKRR